MIECINFRSYNSGTLQGFADFFWPEKKMNFYGCTFHRKNGVAWVNLPNKEYQAEDGTKKFAPVVKLSESDEYEQFKVQAKKAIEDYCMKSKEPTPEETPF